MRAGLQESLLSEAFRQTLPQDMPCKPLSCLKKTKLPCRCCALEHQFRLDRDPEAQPSFRRLPGLRAERPYAFRYRNGDLVSQPNTIFPKLVYGFEPVSRRLPALIHYIIEIVWGGSIPLVRMAGPSTVSPTLMQMKRA